MTIHLNAKGIIDDFKKLIERRIIVRSTIIIYEILNLF